ncbi:MAG: ATP-binding protein [Anaerolineae bacterium]|nr:MAG: ATP-binding protein [Anaerolineae bacterium]
MKSDNLVDWFPRDEHPRRIGTVVGGSLSKGLEVKLDADQSIEELAVGRYVVVHGQYKRFFCMLTDIMLDSTNPTIKSDPPDLDNPFMLAVYAGTTAYGKIHITPMLVIDENENVRPVKTIPAHFTSVEVATVDDVNAVFGDEDETHFNVGSPLELEETQVNLDLRRLVERSIGMFGKSGTGKSFLTRVLMAGLIHRGMAVNLIFDMHNDYGWEITTESGIKVKGLKQLFPSKVSILTLDAESSTRRKAPYDRAIEIGYNEIEAADLAMLKNTLDLSDPMIDAAYWFEKEFRENWIAELLDLFERDTDEVEEVVGRSGMTFGTIRALVSRLRRFERYGFLRKDGATEDSVKYIFHLIEQRKSVVLEFGRYGNDIPAYILVANYLTRRLHHMYVDMVEKSLGDAALTPPQLLITIEEAHKFLDPLIARQTIFGIIAREMRKYNVTLLIVDQRPSAIDEEVMSQVGTRVTALLDNERDINAVLMGISGASGLREVLARLETKQQAIIMGHAVPMPVVIKPRTYDAEFYASLDTNGTSVTITGKPARKLGADRTDRRL